MLPKKALFNKCKVADAELLFYCAKQVDGNGQSLMRGFTLKTLNTSNHQGLLDVGSEYPLSRWARCIPARYTLIVLYETR